ncbi:hypothetical protein [Actinokineospora diospyrosa]|uniref:Uncharacterized protein n=1 Tax=Actinokineospora diospyrosa TaxID=103728 RepID=A0ABT1I766_9PSEU|nr:hypothetical protein [Actinokineospora diospyrosa]MCP2268469.1 hypothetical protein [Actinokineospora diospyrosa]
MAELDDNSHEAKWELINAELSARLTRQDQVLARIEAKANGVGALALTAMPFLALIKPFETVLTTLVALLAFASYVATVGCAAVVNRVSRGSDMNGSYLEELARDLQKGRGHVVQQLIASKAVVYRENNEKNADRAHLWRLSAGLLSMGFACSVACVLLNG